MPDQGRDVGVCAITRARGLPAGFGLRATERAIGQQHPRGGGHRPTSPGGTATPAPSAMTVASPPTAKATTGTPHAMASMAASPKGSAREGTRTTEA